MLQEKLRAIGVHGTELQWFDNYFTNRTQVVSRGGSGAGSLGGAQQLTGGEGGSSRIFP